MALPIINLSVVPVFPAKVLGDGPITVDKSGLSYTLGFDITTYSQNPLPTDSFEVLSYNPADDTTELIPLSSLANAIRAIASEEEAIEGEDNTKTMTSLRTKQSIVANAVGADYDSKATVEGLTLPIERQYLRIAGILYERVASEPAHTGKVASADGAWWEVVDDEANTALAYGAQALEGFDNGPAFQAMIDHVGILRLPKGIFGLKSRVEWYNRTVRIQAAGKDRTVIALSGANAGFYWRNTNTEPDHVEYFSLTGLTFQTDAAGLHTPLDGYWNQIRLVTRRYYDISDVGWTVKDAYAGQWFARLARIENGMGGIFDDFYHRGEQEGTQGGGFLLAGACIATLFSNYHCTYGDTFIEMGHADLVSLHYSAMSGGSQFMPHAVITGETSGATARWNAWNGSNHVYAEPISGLFELGETISDGHGVTATLDGIAASAVTGEGLYILDGEVVGYNRRVTHLPPRHIRQGSITFRIRGHSNTRTVDIDISRARGVVVETEILSGLGSNNAGINFDLVEGFNVKSQFSIAGSNTDCIRLADVFDGVIAGNDCMSGYATFVRFLNSAGYGIAVKDNTTQATASVIGSAIPRYRPGVTLTQTSESVTAASVSAGGSGYAVGDLIVDGGIGKGPDIQENIFILRVETVGGGGAVTSVSVVNGGRYTFRTPNGSPTIRPVGYAGTGATFNLTWGAGPSIARIGSQISGNIGLTPDDDLYGEMSWDPPSISAGSARDIYTDVTVPGISITDRVVGVSAGIALDPVTLKGIITGSNTVRVYYENFSSSSHDLPAHTVRVDARKL